MIWVIVMNLRNLLVLNLFFDVAIRDKDNNVIGFVAVQWNEVMPDNIDKKLLNT